MPVNYAMPSLFPESTTGAIFSPCRKYRYALFRTWDDGPTVNFIMLNPSTADETANDPTIERQVRRVIRWQQRGVKFGGIVVTNLFAWRSTDPSALRHVDDPVGPENDVSIQEQAALAGMVICAWGGDGELFGRSAQVTKLLKGTLYALKVSDKTGQPHHPLYLSYSLKPMIWRVV